jgi:hypothetical protein
MAYCTSCGAAVAEGAAFCPNCGQRVGSAAAAAATYAALRTDGMAIAALILGIAGLVVFPLIPAIAAIIVGTRSKERIALDPALQGDGLAQAGVILGWVGVVLAAAAVVFFIIAAAVLFSI